MIPLRTDSEIIPLHFTELEEKLAEPGADELKRQYLVALEERIVELQLRLRERLPRLEHTQLTAILAANEAAHRVLSAWKTNGE